MGCCLFMCCDTCLPAQVERLQQQVAQLQDQLDAAPAREEHIRLEAQATAEERMDIQLQQQQLKYERQIQVFVLFCVCLHFATLCSWTVRRVTASGASSAVAQEHS